MDRIIINGNKSGHFNSKNLFDGPHSKRTLFMRKQKGVITRVMHVTQNIMQQLEFDPCKTAMEVATNGLVMIS